MKNKLLTTSTEWTPEFLEAAWPVIQKLAKKYNWEGFIPQFEIVNVEQMIDMMSLGGSPISYNHWTFGKTKIKLYEDYMAGRWGTVYELIFNSDPAVCCLFEDNSACLQLLTMCHAAIGHSHFNKHNYLFKEWTAPSNRVAYSRYAQAYINECEEKYGELLVTEILNAAHALKLYSFDKYKRKRRLNQFEQETIEKNRHESRRLMTNELSPESNRVENLSCPKINFLTNKLKYKRTSNVQLPEDNLLYYIEKHSPILQDWQKEILRIVRKQQQENYPLYFTKVLHEGFASFVHYTLMNDLYDNGYISDGFMFEFLNIHTNVLLQYGWETDTEINPYKLGFELFMDIKRICTNPTDEDKVYFPELLNKNWIDIINNIVANFTDASCILQYLSPHLARKLKLFTVTSNVLEPTFYKVKDVTKDNDFINLRQALANKYDFLLNLPKIEIWHQNMLIDDTLTLVNIHDLRKSIHIDSCNDTLTYLAFLWGRTIKLYTVYFNTTNKSYEFVNSYVPQEYRLSDDFIYKLNSI